MISFVLLLMRFLQPEDSYGVTWDYEPLAKSIAYHAENEPLWPRNENGVERTSDLLVAMIWFESRYDSERVGDDGSSCGAYQISPGTAQLTCEELKDPEIGTTTAMRLIRESFAICKDRPFRDRLSWYAHGGNGCASEDGAKKSRHRFYKAEFLQEKVSMAESMMD
jgi:hypothetical protein